MHYLQISDTQPLCQTIMDLLLKIPLPALKFVAGNVADSGDASSIYRQKDFVVRAFSTRHSVHKVSECLLHHDLVCQHNIGPVLKFSYGHQIGNRRTCL